MTELKTLTTPVVGMHFHPPAKGLLTVARAGSTLRIVPEPENPYDANALRVEIASKNFDDRHMLEAAVAGYGESADGINNVEWWHLGYVPRQQAELYAAQIVALLTPTMPALDAVLGFSASGAPTCTFTLPAEELESLAED